MNMDLRSSSPRTGFPSPSCVNDPEEKEISDDDDCNHKHRRRETMSQSLDGDPVEQTLTQPCRKRNRPFENGQRNSQSHYKSDRDLSKFEKRCPTGANFSRFPGEQGSGRGRGRDYQRDSRFGSVDVTSHICRPGPIPPTMFSGIGLSNVSNAQSASWNSFGLIPAVPNGTVDAINPLGFPRVLRPQLNLPLNMRIQRQRCRDFEERGFCLRGDMCPMEHGFNRIVVEDVQSLSQFNLPRSLSSAHALGSSPGGGLLPSVSASSSALMNSKGLHYRISRSAADDSLNFDGTVSGAIDASGGDLYDPDQPLWDNDAREISTSLLGMQHPNFYELEALLDADLSDHLVPSSGAAVGSQSTTSSVWGGLNKSKHNKGFKEKFDRTTKSSEYPESRSKEVFEAPLSIQGTSYAEKNNVVTFGLKPAGSTSKLQNSVGSSVRKLTQKAQRTLFVNGIPVKDNKKEYLLSHFKKFGEVIDIYIPANSERAFVQFSKREEAEKALKAPDAVMGSRFIKLWWANRDSIADDDMSNGNNVFVASRKVPDSSASPLPAVVNKAKADLQYLASKMVLPKIPDSIITVGCDLKPVTSNSPKAPPVQKKMENLELLEELRKKQKMLEQKRNEFRRQLDELAKQATGVKSEESAGRAAKRQKLETSAEVAKGGNAKCANAIISNLSLQPEPVVEDTLRVDTTACQRPEPNPVASPKDPLSLKQALHPVAALGFPFHINRYKLDNRPKSFTINAPLPPGLASFAALRDHFSLFGKISDVEIEELGEDHCQNAPNDSEAMRNCSARISFATRHSAERAFVNGKSWHGHNLHFIWAASGIPCGRRSSGDSCSPLKNAVNADVRSADKTQANFLKASGDPPAKPMNEVSCGNSRSGGGGSSPVAGVEHSVSEADSPDKSVSYIPLEGDELENKDSQWPEEIAGSHEDLKAGLPPLAV